MTESDSSDSTIPIPGTPPLIITKQHCNNMIKYWIYRMNKAAKQLRNFSNDRRPKKEHTTPINQLRDEYRDAKDTKEWWEKAKQLALDDDD